MSSQFDPIQLDTLRIDCDARGVASLTLDRADKHNAMSAQMIDDLKAAADRLGHDDAVRVVVLGGNGKSFCAGGDLGWMRDQMQVDSATRAAGARKLAQTLYALNTLPKPLIGRVHGNAFGGGIGMMSVCDVAIGADHARFGLTEARLGLIPATISPYVVSRMGEAHARRVFMSARLFDAAEAVTLGLLARAVPEADLDAAIEAEVTPYLSCAPGAVAASKKLTRMMGPRIDDAVIEATVQALVDTWEGTEAPQGIAAFFDKKPAPWQG